MFTRMKWMLGCLGILLTLLIAACNGETPTPTAETSPEATADPAGYPAPADAGASGYPVMTDAADKFEANLTPVAPPAEVSADTGAFSLQMLYAGTENPVRGQLFFAAEMLPVEGIDEGFIPKLDQVNAPSGISDSMGQVHISLITPGKYALALMTPLGPILVESVEDGEAILFDITADMVTDLGTLEVNLDADLLEP